MYVQHKAVMCLEALLHSALLYVFDISSALLEEKQEPEGLYSGLGR